MKVCENVVIGRFAHIISCSSFIPSLASIDIMD